MSRIRRALVALPIRLRLTLAFAAAMALAFGAVGTFIYVQFRDDLLHTLDAGLRDRLRDVTSLASALASFAGHEVAEAALRPVERMRARASSITESNLAERLPLAPADDEIGRLGTTLNDLLARLEAAVARERRVVSDASHELRT